METGQKRTQPNNNISDSEQMILSIQVSLNGLSFCILDQKANHISYLKAMSFDKKVTPDALLDHLKTAFQEQKELQQDFGSVQVIHENELSTLVPDELFDETQVADFLKFNSRILKTDYIATDQLTQYGMVNVYVPYVNINNYIYDQFGAFNYLHYSSILLNSVLGQFASEKTTRSIVHITELHFEVIVCQNGELMLYNTFNYKTKEDFIYYLLFSLEQLNLDPDEAKIDLLGHIDEQSELYGIAYKYIRHLDILSLSPPYNSTADKNALLANFVLINSF